MGHIFSRAHSEQMEQPNPGTVQPPSLPKASGSGTEAASPGSPPISASRTSLEDEQTSPTGKKKSSSPYVLDLEARTERFLKTTASHTQDHKGDGWRITFEKVRFTPAVPSYTSCDGSPPLPLPCVVDKSELLCDNNSEQDEQTFHYRVSHTSRFRFRPEYKSFIQTQMTPLGPALLMPLLAPPELQEAKLRSVPNVKKKEDLGMQGSTLALVQTSPQQFIELSSIQGNPSLQQGPNSPTPHSGTVSPQTSQQGYMNPSTPLSQSPFEQLQQNSPLVSHQTSLEESIVQQDTPIALYPILSSPSPGTAREQSVASSAEPSSATPPKTAAERRVLYLHSEQPELIEHLTTHEVTACVTVKRGEKMRVVTEVLETSFRRNFSQEIRMSGKVTVRYSHGGDPAGRRDIPIKRLFKELKSLSLETRQAGDDLIFVPLESEDEVAFVVKGVCFCQISGDLNTKTETVF